MRIFARVEVGGSPARLKIALEQNRSSSDTPEYVRNGDNMVACLSKIVENMCRLYAKKSSAAHSNSVTSRACRLTLVYRPSKREAFGHWELDTPYEAMSNGFGVRTMTVLPLVVWFLASVPHVCFSDNTRKFLEMHNLVVGGKLVEKTELLRQIEERDEQ